MTSAIIPHESPPARRRFSRRGWLVAGAVPVIAVIVWDKSAVERANAADRTLVEAVAANDSSGVRSALERGANPNTEAGFTGFYVPVRRSVWQWARDLVDRPRGNQSHGSRASGRAVSIWPILLVALERSNSPEVIKLLLDHGADAHAKTPDGAPVLEWPLMTGDVDMARLLIRHGADVNAKTEDGQSLVKWATKRNLSAGVIRVLREAGARE